MHDVPLPFELPPPDTTPSRPSRPPRTPADEQPATPEHHTDLPLPLCGNSGSSRRAIDAAEAATLEQLLDRLDRMLALPAAPSLAEVDFRAVRRWAERATADVATRSEGLKLVRQIERVLTEECRTARQISCARERIEQRRALARERAAGTHWKRRDAGRRAKQPTHVDVDPIAWRRAKVAAVREGLGVGEYVGRLVARAHECPEWVQVPEVETARLFARLTVSEEVWKELSVEARRRGITVARTVGAIVESSCQLAGTTSHAKTRPR